nr:MAG TPA: hypothetical protein [Caudoviricetes sp.]
MRHTESPPLFLKHNTHRNKNQQKKFIKDTKTY